MRVLRSFCSAMLLAVLTLYTLPTFATAPADTPPTQGSRHVVEPQRNPDVARRKK